MCPHRGFKLCEGAGRCDDGLLRRGFHGWRFDLAGPVREISSQATFGRIRRQDYGPAVPEGARIAEVIDQDLDGIGRVHAGMQSAAFDHVSLGGLECRLVAMHSELDRWLGLG